MPLQSFGMEVRYAQNRKTPLGTKLVARQQCSTTAEIDDILQLAVTKDVKTLVICFDFNYTHLRFSCQLPLWKHNYYKKNYHGLRQPGVHT